jgi:hypothetical protein
MLGLRLGTRRLFVTTRLRYVTMSLSYVTMKLRYVTMRLRYVTMSLSYVTMRLSYGRFSNSNRGIRFVMRHGAGTFTKQARPKPLGDIFVDGAGMGLLFRYTELWQHVDDRVRGNFELSCQLVDTNFHHKLLHTAYSGN